MAGEQRSRVREAFLGSRSRGVGSLGKSHSNSIWTLLTGRHHGVKNQHDIDSYLLLTDSSKLTNERGECGCFARNSAALLAKTSGVAKQL
jgi:hypothetical protein